MHAGNIMETEEIAQESVDYEEETNEENLPQEDLAPLEPEKSEPIAEPPTKPEQKKPKQNSSFIHGLAVGLGLACIATFAIMWITIFFSPLLPQSATYESLLAIFIYPLIYLLAVGLVALTAGIVREYYSRKY
jgi:hypothetical protein